MLTMTLQPGSQTQHITVPPNTSAFFLTATPNTFGFYINGTAAFHMRAGANQQADAANVNDMYVTQPVFFQSTAWIGSVHCFNPGSAPIDVWLTTMAP